jgi:hypothetical protein
MVHDTWAAWWREQQDAPAAEYPLPWECVNPGVQELDRRIGEAVATYVAAEAPPAVAEKLRQRPGDQHLPVPNGGPSMHDLVTEDLACWEAPDAAKEAVAGLLAARKQLGLERYGSYLQAGNHRNWRRDLAEELADASVYARQGLEELGAGPEHDTLTEAYNQIVDLLLALHRTPGGTP